MCKIGTEPLNAEETKRQNNEPAIVMEEAHAQQQQQALQNRQNTPAQAVIPMQAAPVGQLLSRDKANLTLLARAKSTIQPAVANEAAAGVPMQIMKPAKRSWKQRRQDAKVTKEVRKHTSIGDHVTYAIAQSVGTYRANRDNSYTDEYLRRAKATGVDTKMLGSFLKGYAVDAHGEPLNAEERQKRDDDIQFMNDYMDADRNKRWPHLERITREMLEVEPLTPEMLSDDYLEHHAGEIIRTQDKMTYFENILRDPDNRPFFDSLPPLERRLLDSKFREGGIGGTTSTLFVYRLLQKGIHLQINDFLADEVDEVTHQRRPSQLLRVIDAQMPEVLQRYREQKAELDEQVRQAYQQELYEQLDAEPEVFQTGAQRTREEAISTPSDLKDQKSRQELFDLNVSIRRSGAVDVADALDAYIQGTRYKVGYTEERRLLKVALNKLESAGEGDALNAARAFLNRMTNGTLEIPDDAEILDFSKDPPVEEGGASKGSSRNAAMRKFVRWSDQKDTPLFSHEPSVNDLKQRLVSNCYMVAATAGVVNLDPALLKQCLRENDDHTVTVRLYKAHISDEERAKEEAADRVIAERVREREERKELLGDAYSDEDFDRDLEEEMQDSTYAYIAKAEMVPIYVKVSKEIPRIGSADALSAGALWMQMIEKACAYVGRSGSKGYRSLWYGYGGDFLQQLLGIPPQDADTKNRDGLFEDICNARERRLLFNAGTNDDVGSSDGLNAGHAYTIMGGKEENGKRYVLLRNPYSTMSLQQGKNGKISRTGRMLDTSSDETYGQFYMEYDEFLKKFKHITKTDLNPQPPDGAPVQAEQVEQVEQVEQAEEVEQVEQAEQIEQAE